MDIAIGTEEEFFAALSPEPEAVMSGQSITNELREDLNEHLHRLQSRYEKLTLIVKRSAQGASIFSSGESVTDVPGFAVEVLNTVGAGDAFASGLIYGYLQGWQWHKAVRFANACGALVVTRHGCAKAMPYLKEITEFIESHGGF